ncbi:hypothetical protein H6G06_26150 [Anabaena sphaerica FACHB-251]|uniref:Uncharacterized protein n=1 Tax=Anabaena sphaerica FACHB-251 TaxID=2692883 RepID=A0A926WPE2_9NOST|nr:hypothetical protein [Anabaena sphaerica]MBD2296863.1 hypothetical protein [Anabaena sphaerica FACHB-251]
MKALPPAKNMKIKNHVTPKGKALNSQLSAKFGITLADFEKAVMGDLIAVQRIGELHRQAEFMTKYAPRLKEQYLEIIEGTETYNLALADILQAAGKSTLAIDKAANATAIADRKFVHGKIELSAQYLIDKKLENDRHKYQLNYQEVKGYMDAFLVGVDRDVAVLEQNNRPEWKQIEADKKYQEKVIDEYLDNGNDARVDLIPQKNYRGIKGKIQQLLGALGF